MIERLPSGVDAFKSGQQSSFEVSELVELAGKLADGEVPHTVVADTSTPVDEAATDMRAADEAVTDEAATVETVADESAVDEIEPEESALSAASGRVSDEPEIDENDRRPWDTSGTTEFDPVTSDDASDDSRDTALAVS